MDWLDQQRIFVVHIPYACADRVGELEKLVGNGFYISKRLVEAILRMAGESIESHPKLQKIFIP
jgi:hypothetical protein